jgi:hypothetical protein
VPLLVLRFPLIMFLGTTLWDIILEVSRSLPSSRIWYPLDLVTFLGFFNPLMGGPIVVKLELELSVFVGGYLVLEALI